MSDEIEKDDWSKHLRSELLDADITVVPYELFECLDLAIGEYREHLDQPRPNTAKNELNSILKKVEKLRKSIDATSYEAYAYLNDLHGNLCQAEEFIKAAIATYPGSGGQYDYHRLHLAERVAKHIQDHLGIPPTTTKEGVYERILTVVLRAATGKEPKSVNDLVRRATTEVNQSQ